MRQLFLVAIMEIYERLGTPCYNDVSPSLVWLRGWCRKRPATVLSLRLSILLFLFFRYIYISCSLPLCVFGYLSPPFAAAGVGVSKCVRSGTWLSDQTKYSGIGFGKKIYIVRKWCSAGPFSSIASHMKPKTLERRARFAVKGDKMKKGEKESSERRERHV